MKSILTLILSAVVLSAGAQNFNWTAQSSGTSERLNDIQFVDDMNGWAVGDKGTIVATTDGGETWSTQTSGTDQILRSVFFLSADTGWISGGLTTQVFLNTVDGGENWTPIEAVIPEASWLTEIQFSSASHGFGITAWDVYSTQDGGSSWEIGTYGSSISSIQEIRDLHVLSDSSAFICGKFRNNSNRTRPGVFENLTNSEGHWIQHGAGDFETDDELTAIHFTDMQKGFVGGMNGKIYTMEADGNIFPSVWEFNFDSRYGWVRSIDFSTSDRGMFNVSTEEEGVTIQLIYHTGNAGESWSLSPDRIEGLLSAKLTTPDPEHAWIAGSAGQIYKGEPKFPLSVSTATSLEFSISPNPFVADIRITTSKEVDGVTLTIFNNTGQQVKVLRFEEPGNNFEVSGLEELQSGVYFVNLSSSAGNLNATRKLVRY